MVSFFTHDGRALSEDALYSQWCGTGREMPLRSWVLELVNRGEITLVSGRHEITYRWYLKHCRELENENIRELLRKKCLRQWAQEGLSRRDAAARMKQFVRTDEYQSLLAQEREQSPALRRLQNEDDPQLRQRFRDYQLRLLDDFAASRLDVREFLEGLSLEEPFRAVFQTVLTDVTDKLKIHLQTRKQFLPVRSGTTSRRWELTPGLLPQFLTHYLSHWNAHKLADAMDGMSLDTYLRGRHLRPLFIHRSSALSTYWARSNQKRREQLLNAVIRRFLAEYPLQMLLEAAAREFTRENVLELLLRNPLYSEMALDYRENQEHYSQLDRQILDHMPESFVDLYPLARQQRRRFYLHLGPTNSGKTHQALQAFRSAESGICLSPLRLLAYEIFERTNLAGVPCDLCTGEEEIPVPEARHISCTIEMLPLNQHFAAAVIDEAQMLQDEERGAHWTTAILGVWADEIHICAAPHAKNILIQLIESCGDDYTILEHQRQTPLIAEEEPFTFPESVRQGDALIVFSKNSVLKRAAVLQQQGIRTSVIYGALPYDVRQEEVRRFTDHETDVVVATDAIGMGLNLPIRRVVFLENQKFDGIGTRNLSASEVKQIAGRAGRRGIFDEGYFNAACDPDRIRRKYGEHIHSIRHVYIDFPQSLLALEGKLSYLMAQWNAIPDNDLYRKGNIATEMELCTLLENESQDKELIYRFVTIPFAENNRSVKQLWLELFRLCQAGFYSQPPLEHYLPEDCTGLNLEQLELCYQYGDLLYHYCRRFCPDLCRRVDIGKAAISREISRLLSQQAI